METVWDTSNTKLGTAKELKDKNACIVKAHCMLIGKMATSTSPSNHLTTVRLMVMSLSLSATL
jgi:hypothetical protein